MANNKRARACDPCHSIKIKCELGTSGGSGPCERCVRLGKDCIITPPKTQKDRVAELEAQVANLTRLLENQKIAAPLSPEASPGPNVLNDPARNEPQPEAADPTPVSKDVPQKKRRREESAPAEEGPTFDAEKPLLGLDSLVSRELQKKLVEKYSREIVPLTPLIPLADIWTYERLRESNPVLLQTVVYASTIGVWSEYEKGELGHVILNTLTTLGNQKDQGSVELIQAILVAVLWYRPPKNHRALAAFTLAQLAADVANNIDLWGLQAPASRSYSAAHDGSRSAEALRTWLVCHLLSANLTVLMRKPMLKSLKELDEFSLHMLEYVNHRLPTDRELCHFVRAERLCERILSELKLADLSHSGDISDPAIQMTMRGLQNSITDFATQLPLQPQCATLAFYEHMATIYLYEIALHTPTNKQSFKAPFLAERLSITDFPAPLVTPEHVTSIYALKTACHSVLDLFFFFDIQMWLALPFLLFVGRIAYAQYILAKLYIATTAPGNSYGALLDAETLLMEQYLDKFIEIATAAEKIDPSAPAARILLAPARLKEWYLKYKSSNAPDSGTMSGSDYYSTENSPAPALDGSLNWDEIAVGSESIQFDMNDLFPDLELPSTLNEPFHFDADWTATGTG